MMDCLILGTYCGTCPVRWFARLGFVHAAHIVDAGSIFGVLSMMSVAFAWRLLPTASSTRSCHRAACSHSMSHCSWG